MNFLAVVIGGLALAVFVVWRQEARLRRRDAETGCTTYAKVAGSGTFLLTLDASGLRLKGTSRSTRGLPEEHHPWADVEHLSIERAGRLGSGGTLTVRLPGRTLHASIGRVDEMAEAAARYQHPD